MAMSETTWQIIREVQKYQNARVFAFGIGRSVNRFLLDKMAEAGRGEVEYVGLNDDGSAAARRFHERVRNPLLTDISIDWNGLPVADVYPKRIPDLFAAKPVVLNGTILFAWPRDDSIEREKSREMILSARFRWSFRKRWHHTMCWHHFGRVRESMI